MRCSKLMGISSSELCSLSRARARILLSPHTQPLWAAKATDSMFPGAIRWVCAWNRADTARPGCGPTWESLKRLRTYFVKGRIPSWGLFLHYWMPIDRQKNQLNVKKLFPRTGYKTTLISKALLFLWIHCYVPKLLNNMVLIEKCF